MDLSKITQLIEKLKGGFQTAIGAGPGPLKPEDVVSLQRGPQENRGFGNIMQNIGLIGARQRAAQEQLTESDEDRAAKLDLQKAQAENLRSLGPYRQRLTDISADRAEIARLAQRASQAKSEADVRNAAEELRVHQQNAQAAMLSAQARMKSTNDVDEYHDAELTLQREKFKYDQGQDAISNNARIRAIAVQEGWLTLGQEKAPGEMEHTAAATNKLISDTNAISPEERATNAKADALTKALSAIYKGQTTGVLTPEGTKIASEKLGVNEPLGVNPPEKQNWFGRQFGTTPKQNPRTIAPKTPVKPPTPIKKTTTPKTVLMLDRQGNTREVDAKDVPAALAAGYKRK